MNYRLGTSCGDGGGRGSVKLCPQLLGLVREIAVSSEGRDTLSKNLNQARSRGYPISYIF